MERELDVQNISKWGKTVNAKKIFFKILKIDHIEFFY